MAMKGDIHLPLFDLAEDRYFRGDFDQARALCMHGATIGDSRCQRLLGWIYLRGNGCEIDRHEALQWFAKAAETDVEAVFGIGVASYEMGDYREAAAHFELAGKLGYVPAIRWSGVMYHLGMGVERDIREAERRYLDAARKGNLPAYLQYNLLMLHGAHGFIERLIAIPKLAHFLVSAFAIALKNRHSARLM